MSKRRSRASGRSNSILALDLDRKARLFEKQSAQIPLLHDLQVLIDYIQINKVVGSTTTGNMSRKAIREVTSLFVKPPELDRTIGERTYLLKSEFEVWQLYLLHVLSDLGGLIEIHPARQWRVTPFGTEFPEAPAYRRLCYLLSVWWHKTNWQIAYPIAGLGEQLPYGFSDTVFDHLRSLTPGQDISFPDFADKLISSSGLIWTSADTTFHQDLLQHSIERMVLDVLASFQAVDLRFHEKTIGEGVMANPIAVDELVSFQITPLGDALLDAIAMSKLIFDTLNDQ